MRKIGEWLLWATDFLQATLSTPSSTCCIIWGAQCKMKMRDKCLKKNQEFQDSNSNGCRPWGQHVGQCFLPSSSLRRSVAMCRIHPASWLPSSLTSSHQQDFPVPFMWFICATSEIWISKHPTLTPRTRLGSNLQASPSAEPCPRRPLFHQPYCTSLIMNFQPSRVLSSVLRGHSPTLQSFPWKHLSLCCVSLAKHQPSNFLHQLH